MAGNVWERVQDPYQKDYYCNGEDAAGEDNCESCGPWPGFPEVWVDPSGPEQGATSVRGGRFGNVDPAYFRVSNRDYGTLNGTSDGVGIRCCKELPGECAPDCGDRECGGDGCGGLCGECADGIDCSSEGQCQAFAVKLTTEASRIGIANAGFGIGSGSWSFEFWVKVHSEFNQNAKYLFVMNEQYATYGIRAYLAEADGKTVVSFTNYIGGAGGVNGSSTEVGDGGWHHVAWVFEGGAATVFTDGVPGPTVAGSGVLKAQSSMSLGRPSGYNTYYAAPAYVGPIRFSSSARYGDAFEPEAAWQIDGNTVGQWLVKSGFDGTTLVDEAGGNNNGQHEQGVISATMP